MQSQGITRYILDLRSNPGGLVRSGMFVCMWTRMFVWVGVYVNV